MRDLNMQVEASAKPERLEDLGRVREKLEKLFEQSEALQAGRMHDERFMEIYEKGDNLEDLYMSLKYLHYELFDCLVIARGTID